MRQPRARRTEWSRRMGLTATLQSFAEGTGRKLGPWTGATFRTGDQWQRTMVDWAAGLATPAPGTQRRAMRTLFDCISQSAELLKASAPTKESGLRWLEFQNR